jgi:hypothetical protein
MVLVLEEYASGMGSIAKKNIDANLHTILHRRAEGIGLAQIIDRAKMPAFPAYRPPGHAADGNKPGRRSKAEALSQVPPEIEVELKAAGWAKVTGTWKKKGPKTYEVTNGDLTADLTDGALGVNVLQDGTGDVEICVRGAFRPGVRSTYYSTYEVGSGFGFKVKAALYQIFSPQTFTALTTSASEFQPILERSTKLPEGAPKSNFTMIVTGTKLEYLFNGTSVKKCNYNIDSKGPFMIKVRGTRTIELPLCKAQ